MKSMRISLFAALLVSVSLGGCGLGGDDGDGGSDRDAVEQVMSDLETASREGDGDRICDQIFTPKLADNVTDSSNSGSCATEVKDKLFARDAAIEVQNIDVPDESNATATVEEANGNTSTIFLVKQSGRWRIRSVAPA
jgi:hypothetical protein